VVFEKQDRPGGILRYGIPDFKLEKRFIDRRLEQLAGEGVHFETGVVAGTDISAQYIRHHFDAVLIATGASVPRSLQYAARELHGVHFAMEYLKQQNRLNAGVPIPPEERIEAAGKDVVVIGGGDTGSDCVGTARRQGARSITQVELLSEPPAVRREDNPWPTWPDVMRTSSSQEEGCVRMWGVMTQSLAGADGKVKALKCVRLEWPSPGRFSEIPGSEFELKADLVLMAMGFLHVEHGPLIKDFGIQIDKKGNIAADEDGMTSAPGVFAAGDGVLGASLVVRAIGQGRKAAKGIDRYLIQK
jgi:glutamate synthase (NADPH/NADH) small chain